MSLLCYIDNEVPGRGEWDAVSEVAGSTIAQGTEAAFPERGSLGLRNTVVDNAPAYVTKNLTWPAGCCECYAGVWIRLHAGWSGVANGHAQVAVLATEPADTGRRLVLFVRLESTGQAYLAVSHSDIGDVISPQPIPLGRWCYVVVGIRWAGDGWRKVWQDGAVVIEDPDRDFSGYAPTAVALGHFSADDAVSYTADYDELKVATSYPPPYAPSPAGQELCPERVVVLWRGDSPDSRSFAEYCVDRLGIPRANLVRLDGDLSQETLGDYQTFQNLIEEPLSAYLQLNPDVAGNCTCFLLGYGLPGCFMHEGSRYSATSRLMRLGSAFSPGTSNPLYRPDAVERLTAERLRTEGLYLATRIDADTLADAQAMIDRAGTVASLEALPGSDVLYTDQAQYRSSLACQRLRIRTGDSPPYQDDAFVWANSGSLAFGTAGSRAAFVCGADDSLSTLRSLVPACAEALHSAGYAAAVGSASAADEFDAESFFEMLRIGGTFAEAAAVCVSRLDYTAVASGSPLLVVAFARAGFNVYRGPGGPERIDWDNPVALLRSDQTSALVDHALVPHQRSVYAVRAVSARGVEEHSTHVVAYVELDETGRLLPPPLARPVDVTAEFERDGSLRLGFTYPASAGMASPDGFDILTDRGTGQLDTEQPLATIDQPAPGQLDFEIRLDRPQTDVLLAVRARSAGQPGPISPTVLVAPPPAPQPAEVLGG